MSLRSFQAQQAEAAEWQTLKDENKRLTEEVETLKASLVEKDDSAHLRKI